MVDHEPIRVEVENRAFYIHPFGALYSANLSAEVLALAGPILSGFAGMNNLDELMGQDLSKLVPLVTVAFGTIAGDKVESLISKLLLKNNVALESEDGSMAWLDKNLCDDLFSRNIINLYKLVLEVIKINFGDFFELFSIPSGNPKGMLKNKK